MTVAIPITLHLDAHLIVSLTTEASKHGLCLDAHLTEILTQHGQPARGIESDHAALIAAFILLALRVRDEGRFDEDFTLNVFRTAISAPRMRADYESAIGGDAYAPNLPGKFLLNMSLGWHIRNAVGAVPKRDASGQELRRRIGGEVLDSYTLLEMEPLSVAA